MTTQTNSRLSIVKRKKPDQPSPNERLWLAIDDHLGRSDGSISLEEVRAALADGADPNMELEGNLKYPTLLVQVALFGDRHLPIIRALVKAGAELHDMPEGHYTPGDDVLGTALMQDQYKAAALLIDLGADVNRHGHFGEFLSGLDGGATSEQVALARKMFDAGGHCDRETLASLRWEEDAGDPFCRQYDPETCYQLTDSPDAYCPGNKNFLDLLEEWMAERRAKAMDSALPPAAEQPRARERL